MGSESRGNNFTADWIALAGNYNVWDAHERKSSIRGGSQLMAEQTKPPRKGRRPERCFPARMDPKLIKNLKRHRGQNVCFRGCREAHARMAGAARVEGEEDVRPRLNAELL